MMLKDGLIHVTIMRIMKYRFIYQNKKLIGLFKDELGGKIMTELVTLRAKAYVYLVEDGSEREKANGKKCVIKRELMFKNYKDSLFNDEIKLKSQQRFKSNIIRCI